MQIKGVYMKLKKNNEKRIIIIDGPSGAGKDAIFEALVDRYPNHIAHVVSTTTRPMRINESQGSPYNFVDDETFEAMVKNGDIFEKTERHGTKRGMSQKAFDDILSEGKYPIKDCDKNGLFALNKLYGDKIISIFLSVPKDEIERRLIKRGDSPEDLKRRLDNYDEYIKQSKYYDHIVENLDFEKALDEIIKIISK